MSPNNMPHLTLKESCDSCGARRPVTCTLTWRGSATWSQCQWAWPIVLLDCTLGSPGQPQSKAWIQCWPIKTTRWTTSISVPGKLLWDGSCGVWSTSTTEGFEACRWDLTLGKAEVGIFFLPKYIYYLCTLGYESTFETVDLLWVTEVMTVRSIMYTSWVPGQGLFVHPVADAYIETLTVQFIESTLCGENYCIHFHLAFIANLWILY